jgi:hypothetical protein
MTILFSELSQTFSSFFFFNVIHIQMFDCLVLRRLIESPKKQEKRYLFSSAYMIEEVSMKDLLEYTISSLQYENIDFTWLLKKCLYSAKRRLFWPRSCPPNIFCLFYAHEAIAFTLLELCLLSIFNQDHRICVHVREDDKSIIGLLCSASETEAVITISLYAFDDAIYRLNEKITSMHAHWIYIYIYIL